MPYGEGVFTLNEQVKRDLSRSANVLVNKIVPILEQVYKNSRYICLETINQEFAKDFDVRAGIDAWQIIDDKIRGIGSRIQHGVLGKKDSTGNIYPYDTFTIRIRRDSGAKTEYEKRKEVINNNEGWIYPYFTLHAYTDENDNLLQFALAETTDLIDIINNKKHKERRTNNATFGYIEWSKDLCILIYKNEKIIYRRPETYYDILNILALNKLPASLYWAKIGEGYSPWQAYKILKTQFNLNSD